jgi:hypothetical protein
MALLGGPADIEAMQRELEVTAGPLNLEAPFEVPGAAGSLIPDTPPAAAAGELPSGDQIAALITVMLDQFVDHLSDRAAFCKKLDHAIADFVADGSTLLGGGDDITAP